MWVYRNSVCLENCYLYMGENSTGRLLRLFIFNSILTSCLVWFSCGLPSLLGLMELFYLISGHSIVLSCLLFYLTVFSFYMIVNIMKNCYFLIVIIVILGIFPILNSILLLLSGLLKAFIVVLLFSTSLTFCLLIVFAIRMASNWISMNLECLFPLSW